jgi:hypothetical protein
VGAGEGGPGESYFTNIGPRRGPILRRDRPDAIGVIPSPDDPRPIGLALGWHWDADGRAISRLTVHRVELVGLSVVVARELRPAQEQSRGRIADRTALSGGQSIRSYSATCSHS